MSYHISDDERYALIMQDVRSAVDQRKALASYADRFAAIAMALDDRPGDRRQLLNELDTCATNYYRDKMAGRFGC